MGISEQLAVPSAFKVDLEFPHTFNFETFNSGLSTFNFKLFPPVLRLSLLHERFHSFFLIFGCKSEIEIFPFEL